MELKSVGFIKEHDAWNEPSLSIENLLSGEKMSFMHIPLVLASIFH